MVPQTYLLIKKYIPTNVRDGGLIHTVMLAHMGTTIMLIRYVDLGSWQPPWGARGNMPPPLK